MKTKDYTKIDYTSSNKPNKRWVQSYYYKISKAKGSILMLCGPALKEHIQDARNIINSFSTIFIYEVSKQVFDKNIKDLKKIKSKVNIEIKNEDIINAEPQRIIDLDFCGTLLRNLGTIKYFYNQMLILKDKHKSKKLFKHLLITFSLRDAYNISCNENIQLLCDIFKINNEFVQDSQLKNKYNHIKHPYISYYKYKDGTPMCTFSIQW